MLRAALFGVVVLWGGCGEASAPASDTGADTAAIAEDTGIAADTTPVDTGSVDPWDGGPPSAECTAHCACMAEQCATVSGYPYKSEKECTNSCGRFSAAELKCWSYFCTAAKAQTGSTKTHSCQHAWGTLGLEECPK